MSATAEPTPTPAWKRRAGNATGEAIPQWRLIAHLVASLLVVAGYWLAGFGLPALLLWWQGSDRPEYATGHVNEAAVGALLGVLLGGGALAQSWRPLERIAVTQHTLLASLAAAGTFFIAGRGTDIAGNAQIMLVLTAVLFAAHPAKRQLAQITGHVKRVLLALAIPGGSALVGYAVLQGGRQLGLSPDVPAAADGRAWLAEIAGAAIAIAVVAVIAALGRPGWRITGWSAGLATGVLGASWIAFPTDDGSLGTVAGAIAIAGGIAFVTVTEMAARRP